MLNISLINMCFVGKVLSDTFNMRWIYWNDLLQKLDFLDTINGDVITSEDNNANDTNIDVVLADPNATTVYENTDDSAQVEVFLANSEANDNTAYSLGNNNNNGRPQTCNSDLVYKSCNHKTTFTDQQMDRARVWLQNRFRNASIPPQKPACPKLRLRKEFKCLSHDEKMRFINALRKLYKTGQLDYIIKTHAIYWGSVHKLAEGTAFHRWMVNVVELLLIKIDPSITMPYWDVSIEYAAPEKSIIWYYFGEAGDQTNDYCIRGGAFDDITVNYPQPHCIRRKWNPDRTITRWESSEFMTSVIQGCTNFTCFFYTSFSQHFKKHLDIGEYPGDMSVPYAPNDPTFWLYHNYGGEYWIMLFFLQGDPCPIEFNDFPRYDYQTGQLVTAHIQTDPLTGFPNTTVAEAMQIGFGDLCYITDHLVEKINNYLDNNQPPLPLSAQRLKQSLPPNILQLYYPKFAANTATSLDYDLPDVCDPRRCQPMPLFPYFNQSANGIRQIDHIKYDLGVDLSLPLFISEQYSMDFVNTLNKYNYCSPYIT